MRRFNYEAHPHRQEYNVDRERQRGMAATYSNQH